jgi:hypothetical protein
MGRRMDDTREIVEVPTLGHRGDRQRATGEAAGSDVVPALAFCAMARRQRAITHFFLCCAASKQNRIADLSELKPQKWYCRRASLGRNAQCAGKSATGAIIIAGLWIIISIVISTIEDTIHVNSTFSPFSLC